MQIVADDDLVPVSCKRRACLRDEEGGVCLELHADISSWVTNWCYRDRETNLERNDEPFSRPLCDQGLEDLRYLVHLNVQTTLARLDLVLRLSAQVSYRKWTGRRDE